MNDAERWNARYRAAATERPGPQPWLVENAGRLPGAGLALDAAMGLGGSAGWLAERGWRVVGVDVAEVAVRRAKAYWPGLMGFVADLGAYPLPAETFDLILDFYYLERALWPQMRRALRPGGMLLLETFVWPTAGPPPINPAYVLRPGELGAAFVDWDILALQEMEQDGRWVGSLVARRPT